MRNDAYADRFRLGNSIVARDEEDVPVEKAAARDEDAGVEDAGEQTAAGAAAWKASQRSLSSLQQSLAEIKLGDDKAVSTRAIAADR